jgi:hypothetical protein
MIGSLILDQQFDPEGDAYPDRRIATELERDAMLAGLFQRLAEHGKNPLDFHVNSARIPIQQCGPPVLPGSFATFFAPYRVTILPCGTLTPIGKLHGRRLL